jgi:hypothetical protein
MLYMFQAVPPPIIRSTQLYIQLQVLSTNTAASCYRGRNGTKEKKKKKRKKKRKEKKEEENKRRRGRRIDRQT